MSVYGLLLICKQAVDGAHGTTAHVYPVSTRHSVVTMVDPDGLFARQLPIPLVWTPTTHSKSQYFGSVF
jgi:hypothetical protein